MQSINENDSGRKSRAPVFARSFQRPHSVVGTRVRREHAGDDGSEEPKGYPKKTYSPAFNKRVCVAIEILKYSLGAVRFFGWCLTELYAPVS
jgi:hypothetical protein